MPDIGVPELLIFGVIVLLLFGPGKAAEIGGALGKSVRAFRRESSDDRAPRPGSGTAPAATAVPPASTRCGRCGAAIGADQRFCVNCGAPRA